jgi:hypothetical protein
VRQLLRDNPLLVGVVCSLLSLGNKHIHIQTHTDTATTHRAQRHTHTRHAQSHIHPHNHTYTHTHTHTSTHIYGTVLFGGFTLAPSPCVEASSFSCCHAVPSPAGCFASSTSSFVCVVLMGFALVRSSSRCPYPLRGALLCCCAASGFVCVV